MVDHLHRDPARFGLVEGAGGVAAQCGPGVFVDFGSEAVFERVVGVAGAEEVGVADEETFLVVVGVDKPTGDALGTVGSHLAGVGMEHVHAFYLDAQLAVPRGENVDIGFAEDDEEVALAVVAQIVGHMEICVHPRLEHLDATEL